VTCFHDVFSEERNDKFLILNKYAPARITETPAVKDPENAAAAASSPTTESKVKTKKKTHTHTHTQNTLRYYSFLILKNTIHLENLLLGTWLSVRLVNVLVVSLLQNHVGRSSMVVSSSSPVCEIVV
jgi:hypothetical protein